jgi:signal transduction histidine kinase/CheY-like chemotaxis protein/PAS domain-containing protein
MEFTKEMFELVKSTFSGYSAIYRINDNILETEYVSPNIHLLFGMSSEEFDTASENNALDTVIPDDLPLVKKAIKDSMDTGEPFDVQYRVIHKTRGFEWIRANGRVFGEKDGLPLMFVSYIDASIDTDIYRNILNQTGSAIYVCDSKNYEVLYTNTVARKLYGHGENFAGKLCYSYIRNNEKPCEDCFLKDLKRGEKLVRKRYSKERHRWEQLTDEYINWCGHDAFVSYLDDINKSEELHLKLKDTTERFELAAQNGGIVLWEYHIKEHKIVYPSEGLRMLGFPEFIENVPESILPMFVKEDQEKVLEMYKRVEAGEQRVDYNLWFYTMNEKKLQCEHVIYCAIKDPDGKQTKALGIGIDITAQQMEFRKFSDSINTMLNSNSGALGTLRANLTRNLCIVSHTLSQLLADQQNIKKYDDFIGTIAKVIVNENAKEKYLELFSSQSLLNSYASGKTNVSFEFKRYGSDGKKYWNKTTVNMLQNPETEDIECVMYSNDITREKVRNDIIRITTSGYDTVSLLFLDSGLLHSFFVSDTIPKYYDIFVLEQGTTIHFDQYRKAALDKFVAEEDKEKFMRNTSISIFIKQLEDTGYFDAIYKMKTNIEGTVAYRKYQHYYLDEDKNVIVIIGSDITKIYGEKQKEIEEKQQLLQQATSANNAKSDFLARMSHDIRTPLNGIMGMTRIAMEHNNSKETSDALEKIDVSAKFLLGLVNDVLDMSKIESGEFKLSLEPYPQQDFEQYIDSVIRPLSDKRNHELTVTCVTEDEYMPILDKLRMNQIAFNLLSNSIKYTNEGGRIEYNISTKIIDDKMEIIESVSDNGRGMSEEFQKVLFEPYRQEDRVRSMEGNSSTGLGLSIVKKIVEMMGGTIEVKSKVDVGTTFTIRLLVDYIKTSDYKANKRDDGNVNRDKLSGKNILVCEDNKINQEIIKSVLESAGMVVSTADDGLMGKQMFERSPLGHYSGILMDIRMPIFDGYEVTRAIRKMLRRDAKTVPIIALSADAFEEDKKKSIKMGMNDHIAKPIDPNLLFAVLSRLINDK